MNNRLNIVLVHYHLNRGGVTRVIENQLKSLSKIQQQEQPIRVLLCYGGRHASWSDQLNNEIPNLDFQLQVIPDLDYSSEPKEQAIQLANSMMHCCQQQGFSAERTVVHAHNHSIGKNASLPGALKIMAESGFGLLLQIHDFAEEFRPQNYQLLTTSLPQNRFSKILYPDGNRIHYAVLNYRDHHRLLHAKANEKRLHFLPNSATMPTMQAVREVARERLAQQFQIEPQEPFVLFPVRGIRRKNLGEMLLHAIVSPDDHHFGITLAPLNPKERKYYDFWQQKAAQWNLRTHFGTGEAEGLSFEENMAAADSILTTSVAEGFGMVFLESWLMNRPLFGRNLPHVTHDFQEAGLQLDSLYQQIEIPADWIDQDLFAHQYFTMGKQLIESYQLTPPPEQFWKSLLENKFVDGHIDFADLDETLQVSVLERLMNSEEDKAHFLDRNPLCGKVPLINELTILKNKQIVQHHFSLGANGQRLLSLYSQILDEPASPTLIALDSGSLLDQYCDLSCLRLLQS